MLRAAGLILENDLRRRIRNRSFIAQTLLGPLLLTFLVSVAFGGGFGIDIKVGVSAQDRSELAQGIQQSLVDASSGPLTFEALDPDLEVRGWVDDQDDPASAIVIPNGFAASLAGNHPLPLQVNHDDQNTVADGIARSVAEDLAARIDAGRLASLALVGAGDQPPDAAALAGVRLPVSLDRRATDEQSAVATVGPGMALLFLFFSVSYVSRHLLEEKRVRVLDRIRAAPVSLTSILLGKCAGLVVVGCTTIGVVWGATTVAVGADWGDPLGVVLITLACSLAIAGIAGVIAGLARTPQMADTMSLAVAFVFGIIGGSLVPLSELPPGLLKLSWISPNGWALHGFADLGAGGGSAVDVLPYVGALLMWALVTGLIAIYLLPRRLSAR